MDTQRLKDTAKAMVADDNLQTTLCDGAWNEPRKTGINHSPLSNSGGSYPQACGSVQQNQTNFDCQNHPRRLDAIQPREVASNRQSDLPKQKGETR